MSQKVKVKKWTPSCTFLFGHRREQLRTGSKMLHERVRWHGFMHCTNVPVTRWSTCDWWKAVLWASQCAGDTFLCLLVAAVRLLCESVCTATSGSITAPFSLYIALQWNLKPRKQSNTTTLLTYTPPAKTQLICTHGPAVCTFHTQVPLKHLLFLGPPPHSCSLCWYWTSWGRHCTMWPSSEHIIIRCEEAGRVTRLQMDALSRSPRSTCCGQSHGERWRGGGADDSCCLPTVAQQQI